MTRVSTQTKRASYVEEDRPLALRVGARLRKARTNAGMTQAQLSAGRYTKAYVSALENGLSKPSMAALNFFADRLQLPIERFLSDEQPAWTRLEADLRLASGDLQSALDAYDGLLETDVPARIRAELLLGRAEGLARLDHGREAVRTASDAATQFRAQRRPAEAALATYWQASGLYQMEQGDQAAALLHQILDAIAGGLSVEPDLHVRTLIALSAVTSRDDEPERALAYLEQARAMLEQLDERKRALFLFALATSYNSLGDYEAAIATGTQSLARFRAAEADGEAARLENELALVYLAMGSLELARTHAALAREYFEQWGDRRGLAHVTESEAQIALAAGAFADAASLATKALGLAEESGDRKAAISAGLSLGHAQRDAGDLEAASLTLEHAAGQAQDMGRRGQLQAVLGAWSDVMAELGDMKRAYELSRQALDAGRR
jgi:transcriptional regulator with XRE-family HTH domain